LNAAPRTGKISSLAGSGSAEMHLGYGGPAEPTRVYSDDSDAAQTDGDAPVSRLLPESGPNGAPSKVGRYVVLDVLGMGGMGVVCTAYDPKLDRKVALKLLRRRVGRHARSSTGRARLVREAQALAKLSHPNIVTVHDVDTTPDGRIYMAMEFVRGPTITQWLAKEKPRWRRIVEVFEQAGRGLAAAHEANITHRDFKPANVLIGEDGRVKVLDFGLAKSETASISTDSDDNRAEQPGESEDIMQVVQSTGDMKLTMAGRIVGTPAYMAPEQRRGRPTGPATDQFGFAVSLYEALYGRLPFRSESHSRDAARGRVIEPPSDSEVPSWVFRAIKRALAPEPADRYPVMADFLAALNADPAKRRRKLALGAGGGVLLGTAIAFAAMAQGPEDALCEGAGERLANVWNPERRDVVGGSLRGTATAYAAYTADRVLAGIDAYGASWVEARTTVCEATRVHGEQSEATLDVRMRCLDERLGELRALVDVLSDADGEVVEQAVSAVASLGTPSACITAEPRAADELPQDLEARRSVLSARSRIDDAEALRRAGRYPAAEDVARDAIALADKTKHIPTIARATYVQGRVLRALGDYDAAGERFRQAAQDAARAGDAALEARAFVAYVGVAGVHEKQPQHARGLALGARTALLRAGSPAELESQLDLQLGASALEAHEIPDAVEFLQRALEAGERAYPPGDVRFADLQVNLGIALAQRGDVVEAEGLLRRALALRESEQGPMHPDVAMVAHNLANVLASKPSGLAEAIEMIDRAMTIRRTVLGADSKVVGDLWMTKARLHKQSGSADRALREYERASDIYRKAGAQVDLGDALNNLSTIHLANRDLEDARRDANEAMTMFNGTSTRALQGRARATLRLCIASRKLGPDATAPGDGAVEHCTDAVARLKDAGVTAPEIYRATKELALALEARGDLEGAKRAARDALKAASTEKHRKAAAELLERLHQ